MEVNAGVWYWIFNHKKSRAFIKKKSDLSYLKYDSNYAVYVTPNPVPLFDSRYRSEYLIMYYKMR